MNLLRRAQGRFRPGREAAVSTLRRATVVASDETGVRIEGSNAFHGVFHSAQAMVHTASPTRGRGGSVCLNSDQGLDKWMSCRVQAAADCGSLSK